MFTPTRWSRIFYMIVSLSAAGLFVASVGSAQTPADLPPGDVDPEGEPTVCLELTTNLRYRLRDAQTNGQVSLLQDFLASRGFLNSEPTGFFGVYTLQAVKDFQRSVGISPTGYVGPLTRAKIKELSCETFSPIDEPFISEATEFRAENRNGEVESRVYLALYNSSGKVVPLDTFNFPHVPIGDYSLKFLIRDRSSSSPYVLARVSVSESGYRIYDIRDARTGRTEEGEISISIEGKYVRVETTTNSDIFLAELSLKGLNVPPLSSNDTGPYWNSNPGEYVLSIFSRSSDGILKSEETLNAVVNRDHKSVSLSEREAPVPPVPPSSITVLSPNGGERLSVGSIHSIRWNYSNLDPRATVSLQLLLNNSVIQTINPNISATDKQFNWTVPDLDGEAGGYRIKITCTQVCGSANVGDSSDGTFAITTHPQPSITVLSPNGGESWKSGSTVSVRWSSNIIPQTAQLLIRLRSVATGQETPLAYALNTGTATVKIPDSVPPGSYTLELKTSYQFQSYVDASDLPFSISSPSTFQISVVPRVVQTSADGTQVDYRLSPESIARWEVTHVCVSPITASAKGGGDCGDTTNFSSFTGGTVWPVWYRNPTGINQAVGLLVKAYDGNGKLVGSAYPAVSIPPTPPRPVSALEVISPNGGEVWTKGITEMIRWKNRAVYVTPLDSSATGSNADTSIIPPIPRDTVNISLTSYTPPCPTDDNTGKGGACPLMPSAIYLIASNAPNSGEYRWTVGATTNSNTTIPDGAYVMRVCAGSQCDQSDSYFKIVSQGANLPPVIDGMSGPTSLAVGETGTWKIEAHDPENGSLSYAVNWGDDLSVEGIAATVPQSTSISQSATFTHRYFLAGTFKVGFTVTDNNGLSVQSTISVQVGQVSATDTDLVIGNVTTGTNFHPYGFYVPVCMNGSKSINDLKKENPLIRSFPIHILVYDANGREYKTDASGGGGIEDLKNGQCISNPGLGVTLQSHQFAAYDQTKTATFSLDYNHLIPETNEKNNDFTFSESSVQPSITVASPNGGEGYTTGDTVTIRWNTRNLAPTENVSITLGYLHNDPTYPAGRLFEDGIVDRTSNTGSYIWKIPEYYARGVVENQFYVRVRTVGSSLPNVSDISDGRFTVKPNPVSTTDFSVTEPVKGVSYSKGARLPIYWSPRGENVGYGFTLLRASDRSFARLLFADYDAVNKKWSWLIPSNIPDGTDYYIRVNEGPQRNRTGYSGAFNITSSSTPTISVVSPNGGGTYRIGGTLPIQWSGNVSGYRIHIDLVQIPDTGAPQLQRQILGNITQPNGSQNWVIDSSTVPGKYKLLVVACGGSGYCTNNDPFVLDESDSYFTINTPPTAPSITVLSPNGRESLVEGSNHVIRWTAANLPSNAVIGITLFRGNQGRYDENTSIASNLPASQREYSWNVSTKGNWGVGKESQPYKFSKLLGIGVAYADGYAYQIMVSAYWGRYVGDGDVWGNAYDRGDSTFNITTSTTSNNQVQGLSAVQSVANTNGTGAVVLKWNAVTTAPIGVYNIYRSTSPNFAIGPSTLRVQGNVLSWTDSSVPVGTYYYKVAAQDVNGTIYQPSDEVRVNVVSSTSVTVLTPNGGEVFNFDQPIRVSWSAQGLSGRQFMVALRRADGATCEFATTTSTSMSITPVLGMSCARGGWTLQAGQYSALVYVVADSRYSDRSDAPFTISVPVTQSSITLTSPATGQIINGKAGSTLTFKWTTKNWPNNKYLKFELVKSDGTVIPIVAAPMEPYLGTYTIGINTDTNGTYKAHVYAIKDGLLSAGEESWSGYFTITPTSTPTSPITLISPNGGESFVRGGTPIPVNWYMNYNPPEPLILYLINLSGTPDFSSGTVYSKYVSGKSGNNSTTINANVVPVAGQYKVQISGYRSGDPNDISDNYFTVTRNPSIVLPRVLVSYPNGGEKLTEGTDYAIRWSNSNIPSNAVINIYLAEETGGQNRLTIAENLPANTTQYVWKAVYTGSKHRILVRAVWKYDPNDTVEWGQTEDYSDSSFIIAGPTTEPSPVSFEAESGTISSPFAVTNGYISQPSYLALASSTGRAAYTFNLAANGTYVVKGFVSAQNTSADSFYLEIDAEPTDPAAVWHIPLTNGFEWRTASWQGSGTWDNSEFVPKYFNLTSGEHTLIIRGREGNTLLDKITIEPVSGSVAVSSGAYASAEGSPEKTSGLAAVIESIRNFLGVILGE